jgi:threonine dehydrogenase-like Zn-dependent dehydrogenase
MRVGVGWEALVRAVVWAGVGALELVDRPVPQARPGWVLVRTGAVGICGTDLHRYRGAFQPTVGLIPGHELGGEVVTAGAGGPGVGMAVAVEPLLACGTCPQCRSGDDNRCRQRTLLGVTGDGGLSDLVVVPEGRVHPLPMGMTVADGALVEPLAVCVRAARQAGVALGDTVAVLGAGTIGLLSVIAARAAGAARVVVVGRYDHQRQRAAALGADAAVTATARAAEVLGDGADVVIETVGGRAATLAEAVELVRPGGVIGMLGVFDGDARLPGLALSRKEARLVASNCYGRSGAHRDFEVAVGLLGRQLDRVRSIVTHRFSLEQVQAAFTVAADRAVGSIKVLVLP